MKLRTRFLITAALPLCLPVAILSPVYAQTPPASSPRAGQSPAIAPEVLKLLLAANKAVNAYHWDEALQGYNKALMLAHTLDDKLGEAATLNNIGQVYANTGQPQKALEFYNQALPLLHAVGNKSVEATTLNNIGEVYRNTGQPQKALEFYNQALPVFHVVGDKDSEATMLNNIGLLYDNTGEPQKALEFYNQALPLLRAVENKSVEATTLNNIGAVYTKIGQPQKALEFYNQALPLLRAVGNKGVAATTLSNIGEVYRNTGQPQKALEFYNQALPLWKEVGDKSGEATTLNNIGAVYARIGQPQKALEFYNQALPLLHAVGNKSVEATTLNNIGEIYNNTGQLQKALEFYNQALPLLHAVGNKSVEATTLNNIGEVYNNMGQPQKALEFYNQALPLLRAAGNKSIEATTLNNIGTVYANIGQRQKALEFFNQALPVFHVAGIKDGEATTLNNIGAVYARIGQPQKALEFYNQALPLLRAVGNKSGEATTLSNIGAVYRQQHDLPHAERALEQSVTLTETIRENLGGLSEAKVAYLESELGAYYEYADVLLDARKTQEAFALAQKMKARALLDTLGGGRASLQKALTDEERNREQTLRHVCDTLNAQMIAEGARNEVGGKKRFEALQEPLRQAERELSKYTDTLYALHPDLARQRVAHTLTAAEAAKLLPSNTALLEYATLLTGKDKNKVDRVVVFVVTPDGKTTAHSLPIHAEQLRQQSAAFRDACADPRKPFRPLAQQLYAALIAPLLPRLTGKTHLLICPDGPLWDVPFAALMAEGQGTGNRGQGIEGKASSFLADRFLITYAYSATGAQAALLARPAGTTTGDVFVLANPDFGNTQRFGDSVVIPGQRPFEKPSRPFEKPSRDLLTQIRGGIAALPGTQREADVLHTLYPAAAIYTGTQAQEATFKTEAGKYKYLHLASHAFFNDAAPMLSSVFLAAPPQSGTGSEEDGFLTARELLDMDLHADLIVLSACQTARGEKHSGEGIVGMTWALFVAGCPTQVLSQWSVDDAATALLMARFYQELKAGQPKGASLRTAERELRRNPKYAHPYYWAPFQLVGQWR